MDDILAKLEEWGREHIRHLRAEFRDHAAEGVLVAGDNAAVHTGTRVGDSHELEKPLEGSIFAGRPM